MGCRGISPLPSEYRQGSPRIPVLAISMTSFSDGRAALAHSIASSFDFTWIIQ
jgi:hypothetical protein